MSASRWRRLAAREIGPLGVLSAAALALAGFAALASEMREGDTHAFDRALLLALRVPGDPGRPVGPAWLHGAMLDLTALGGTTVLTLLTLLVAFYLAARGKRATGLFVAAAIAGGALLDTSLKQLFGRARPDLVVHLVDVHNASFPSGHAMNSAVTYLTLGVLLARAEAKRAVKLYLVGAAILLTLIVGCSRVYLGVHWPSDVLAGWAVGSAWAMLCWAIELWLQRRRAVEPAQGA